MIRLFKISIRQFRVIGLLLCISFHSLAQLREIQGLVLVSKEQAMAQANVLWFSKMGVMKQLAATDEKGRFSLKDTLKSGDYLLARYIGYKSDTLRLQNNQNQGVKIFLYPDAQLLSEVLVQSDAKEADTTTLKIHANATDQTSLREILNKQSNFRVAEDGSILYKGKVISKITINNKPAFIDQNNIALDNIENKVIQKLSLINNYSNKFTLQFEDEKESILNIDTKDTYQNLNFGKVTLSVGVLDKVGLSGNVFHFSPNLNAILSTNTNTVGKTAFQLSDLGASLKEYQQELLTFQVDQLQDLLLDEPAVLKSIVSNNQLTLRKESAKYQGNVELYVLALHRNKTRGLRLLDATEQPLLNITNDDTDRTQAYLANANGAVRLNAKQVFSYQFSGQILKGEDIALQNNIVSNQAPNQIAAQNREVLGSIYGSFQHSIRLNSKLLNTSKVSYLYNWVNAPEKSIWDINLNQNLLEQTYDLQKNTLTAFSEFDYKIHALLIPKIGFEWKMTQERLDNVFSGQNEGILFRNNTNANAYISLVGDELLKRIKYRAKVALTEQASKFADQHAIQANLPYHLNLYYENKLNRILLEIKRTIDFQDIRYGTSFLQPDLSVVRGDAALLHNFKKTQSVRAGYFINHIFEGKIYGIDATYKQENNSMTLGLMQIDARGLQTFQPFIVPTMDTYQYQVFLGKTMFKSFAPIKADVLFSYTQSNGLTYPEGKATKLNQHKYSVDMKIQTLFESKFSWENLFRFQRQYTFFGSDQIPFQYLKNRISVKYQSKKWDATLSFVYESTRIYHQAYQRKNFDFSVNYNLKRLALGIDAQNFDALFNVFKQQSYNNMLNVQNGVRSLTNSNPFLSYILFNVMYKFKL